MQLLRGGHAGEPGPAGGVEAAALLHGLSLTIVAALAASLVAGAVLALSPWEASLWFLKAVNYLAVFCGGLYAGKRAGRLGWLHGGVVGLAYLLLVSWLFQPDFGLADLGTAGWWKQAVFAFLVGAVGGVLGIVL